MSGNASSSNPSSSQVMPARIVKAIEKAEAELNEIDEKWTKAIAERDAIREAMNEKQKQVMKLTEEIQRYDARAKEMTKNMPDFKEMWSTKWEWIQNLKALYR